MVDECYAQTKALLESKRELIEKLAESLLEKESINLPEIIKVLGDRPFPMKETLRDYLEELNKRKVDEDLEEEIDAAKQAMDESTKEEEVVDAAAEKSETAEDESKEKEDESTNIDDVNKK